MIFDKASPQAQKRNLKISNFSDLVAISFFKMHIHFAPQQKATVFQLKYIFYDHSDTKEFSNKRNSQKPLATRTLLTIA
jgi:hypothetical protein